MKPLSLAGLLPLLVTAHAAVLFEDSFDRPDSRNIDAVLTGITDNTSAPLPADGIYTHAWIDPASQSPLYGVQDGNAANGGGCQILSNALQLKVGPGTVNAFTNHNFTDPAIVTAGGFSVSVDILSYTQSTNGQGGAFAIGMTQAEAASAQDAFSGPTRMTGGFGSAIGSAAPAASVSDFWVVIRGDNSLVWGGKSGNVLGVTALPAKTGTIAANFRFTDFNAGSTVSYEVIRDGTLLGTGTFTWSDSNANHLGLDCRDSGFVNFDNFRVATDFIDPVVFPPTADAFEATRLSGTNDTRFHWKVTEGTIGDPLTVTIKNGATTVHTTSSASGFADVDTSGATDFTLVASNSAGSTDPFPASVAPDDAFAAAVRSDAPLAWYRFNEAANSRLIVDSADNAAPFNGNVIGFVSPGVDGPRDGKAGFSGAGASILTTLNPNPAGFADGHTVEAIVQRFPGGNQNAAIVSQTDGTGIGRSHLAVNNDGTVQTFLAGGAAQRKDADVKLPAYTWAHLVMVVDKTVPEIRWYLDGALIGSSADGTNPDGSVFNPAFTVESATGAWRIGTQKDAAQNFWLGEMDEVAIYGEPLAPARVTAHADAWRATASGLLGFSAAAQTINAGSSTTLIVTTGNDATSVSIDNGVGTVTPVNGVTTVPVSPAATTTYTVTVDSPSGTQVLTITVTVLAPPPVVTSGTIAGTDFRITFSGAPSTVYLVRGSLDLLSFPLDLGTATTDGSGLGEAIVPLVPGRTAQFYRIEEAP